MYRHAGNRDKLEEEEEREREKEKGREEGGKGTRLVRKN